MVRSGTSTKTDAEHEALAVELIAMSAIGKGLALLEPEARIRVLRWASECFLPSSTAASPDAAAPAQVPVSGLRLALEPDLTVDTLEDMFEARAASGPVAVLHPTPEFDLTVDDVDEMFVRPTSAPTENTAADPIAVQLAAEDLSDVYESSPAPPRAQLHLVPREELPFDQVVDEFVDSFRRLTRDWQGV
jgi:hypothetical protein